MHRASMTKLGPFTLTAALLLAACGGATAKQAPITTSTTSTTTTIPSTTTTTTPTTLLQTTTTIRDLTWISYLTGWAIGTVACPSGSCGAIFSTTNGGRSWSQATSPAPVNSYTHIRFANSNDGYIWGVGANQLYVTTDGGTTWTKQTAPWIIDLEPIAGTVFRMITVGLPGPAELQVSSPGSPSWTTTALGANSGFFGAQILAANSKNIYIAFPGHTAGGSSNAHTVFARSDGGGASTWVNFNDPCGGTGSAEQDAVVYAAGPGSAFGVICYARQGFTPVSLRLSQFAGNSFSPPIKLPPLPPGNLSLALPAPGTVVIADSNPSGPSAVYTSVDGGATWKNTLTFDGPAINGSDPTPWLGFEDTETGRVEFGTTNQIWTTSDGGTTWTATPVP